MTRISEHGIVLQALSRAAASLGLSFVRVERVAQYTARFMPPQAMGGRMPPMGTTRTRRLLRELSAEGLAVEVKRGGWAVHEQGRQLLDEWRRREAEANAE